MEKIVLSRINEINQYPFYNQINIISNSSEESLGNNSLRLFSTKIIKIIEIIYRNNYSINKIDINYEIINNEYIRNSIFILEFTNNNKLNEGRGKEIMEKDNCLSLGLALFLFKYGNNILKRFSEKVDINIDDKIKFFDLLERYIAYIKARKTSDENSIKFINNLIAHRPEDRFSFDKIYTNKWINKNNKVLREIISSFQNDKKKIIIELTKEDFLEKKNQNSKKKSKFIFKI